MVKVLYTCEVCQAIERDGWNSTKWFHCRVCCACWTGHGRQHCTICHETFNSIGASDLHWTKAFGHLHPINVESLRFKEGIWYGGLHDAKSLGRLLEIRHTKEIVDGKTEGGGIVLQGERFVLGVEEGGLNLGLDSLLSQPDNS